METPSTPQEPLSLNPDLEHARQIVEPDVDVIVRRTLDLVVHRSSAGCLNPSQNPNFENAARFMLSEVIDRLQEHLEGELV